MIGHSTDLDSLQPHWMRSCHGKNSISRRWTHQTQHCLRKTLPHSVNQGNSPLGSVMSCDHQSIVDDVDGVSPHPSWWFCNCRKIDGGERTDCPATMEAILPHPSQSSSVPWRYTVL
jgi:hypothetical protein